MQKLFAALPGVVSASAKAVTVSVGAITACAEAIAAFAGVVFGVFD